MISHSATFTDFDHFRDELRFQRIIPIQIGRGPARIGYARLQTTHLTLIRLCMNRAFTDTSSVEAEHSIFAFCDAPRIFCGINVPPGSIVRLGPGRNYRSIRRTDWKSVEIAIPLKLNRIASTGETTFEALAPNLNIKKLPATLVTRFRQLSSLCFNLSEPKSGHNRAWTQAVEVAAVDLVAESWDRGCALNSSKPERGYRLVTAALETIEARSHELLSVEDIGRELGVTGRALHYAFRNLLGIGVHGFMLAHRLNGVRSKLVMAGKHRVSVTEAATLYDFSHLSRFSQAYRILFGELPSQTLEKASANKIEIASTRHTLLGGIPC